MKLITFPKHEWADIQARFEAGKPVWTIRVDTEFGKYHVGDVLQTEWGAVVEILSTQKVEGGLEALKMAYPFFNEIPAEALEELRPHRAMEILSMKAV